MKKSFQNKWLNIPFSSFYETSSTTLPTAKFYNAFYRSLYEKFPNYDSLDPNWRRSKDELTDWLAASLPDSGRVLSFGCGLGYMEQRLWKLHRNRIELHVMDFASDSLKWLKQLLPANRFHDVDLEDDKQAYWTPNEGERFDLIYLSTVDYSLRDGDLIKLLTRLKGALRDGGQILMISQNFIEMSLAQEILSYAKEAVKSVLEQLNFCKRGQFWGWNRSKQEYRSIMYRSGLNTVTDGFFETQLQRIYWIKGNLGYDIHD